MSHTHFLYHIIFATKDRFPFISAEWEDELYRYLAGIIKNHGGEAIEIGGMPDHTHILTRLEAKESFSDFMRELKASSSKWAKRYEPKFSWQRRFGAFTVSESVAPQVRKYIRKQKEHHREQSFEDEYLSFLRRHKVDFDERYLWD